jgi:hypothetical protein
METAFNWFLGNNRLHQIIYNPCTGGCYDGLEETHVNLNQGAESTVSYLMARLTVEKYNETDRIYGNGYMVHSEKKSIIEEATLSRVKENSSNLTSYFFVADTSGITRKKFK